MFSLGEKKRYGKTFEMCERFVSSLSSPDAQSPMLSSGAPSSHKKKTQSALIPDKHSAEPRITLPKSLSDPDIHSSSARQVPVVFNRSFISICTIDLFYDSLISLLELLKSH